MFLFSSGNEILC